MGLSRHEATLDELMSIMVSIWPRVVTAPNSDRTEYGALTRAGSGFEEGELPAAGGGHRDQENLDKAAFVWEESRNKLPEGGSTSFRASLPENQAYAASVRDESRHRLPEGGSTSFNASRPGKPSLCGFRARRIWAQAS
ncbi:hypothetical protein Dimus_006204 [Dionaea muscipula]